MGLDVDAVIAIQYIDKVKDIIASVPRGQTKEICDDVIEFVDKMKVKYAKVAKK